MSLNLKSPKPNKKFNQSLYTINSLDFAQENTIYNILTAPYQFNPAYAVPYYRSNVTESCITAVDYYFENQSSFPHYTSFWGDGSVNHFR